MMVQRADNARGILVGFELAILQRQDDNSSAGSQNSATETESSDETSPSAAMYRAVSNAITPHVAFLAVDRCSDRPPPHQFRHDLESFLWTFFFVQTCFRNGRRIFNANVEKWYTGSWNTICHEKDDFLKAEKKDSKFARLFAKSLNVDTAPLEACSADLAELLHQPDKLDPLLLLSTLQRTRNAYVELL